MSRLTAVKPQELPDEPDRLEGFSSPREVERLVGHAAARAEFEEALRGGRLHHAWLIVGPEGVGKATLAYGFAREVLVLGHEAHPDPALFSKVAGLSHPNLLLLRRSYNDRTKRYSQWIGVDEVRRLRNFLGHSAGETGWRVVIVDRADELNQNAANALLKALEEPPARTLFLLIATAEGRIPVTIRSRCRALRLSGLGDKELDQAVRAALNRDDHDGDEATLATALALSQGSVRRALELATGEGIGLYRDVLTHLGRLPDIDGPQVQKLADRLSGVSDLERLELFFSLLLGVIERLIRFTAAGEGAIGEEADLARKLLVRESLPAWVDTWEAIGAARDDALALNLDRALLVLETFQRLQKSARDTHA